MENKIRPPQLYLIEGRIRRKAARYIRKLFFKQIEHKWAYKGKDYKARFQVFVPEPNKDFREPMVFLYVSYMEWHVLVPFYKLEDLQVLLTALGFWINSPEIERAFMEAVDISKSL
jgi:hypothetical protein